jgi:hypothetical protein
MQVILLSPGQRRALLIVLSTSAARPLYAFFAGKKTIEIAHCRILGRTRPIRWLISNMLRTGDTVFPASQGISGSWPASGLEVCYLFSTPVLMRLIFLSATMSLIVYVYDCCLSQMIHQEYIDRVKHRAAEPLHCLHFPNTVTVYSTKWPGDDD